LNVTFCAVVYVPYVTRAIKGPLAFMQLARSLLHLLVCSSFLLSILLSFVCISLFVSLYLSLFCLSVFCISVFCVSIFCISVFCKSVFCLSVFCVSVFFLYAFVSKGKSPFHLSFYLHFWMRRRYQTGDAPCSQFVYFSYFFTFVYVELKLFLLHFPSCWNFFLVLLSLLIVFLLTVRHVRLLKCECECFLSACMTLIAC